MQTWNGGNRAPPPAAHPWPSKKPSCKVVSWNAAALFQVDPIKAARKNTVLAKLSLEYDIVFIQEAHGDENDLRARCPQIADSHWCCASQGPNRAVGGVISLFNKEWLGDVVPISETVVEGRAMRSLLDDGWCTLVVYNIHNFELTAQDVNYIAQLIKVDLAAVERDPTRHNVIIAGDWNFCP